MDDKKINERVNQLLEKVKKSKISKPKEKVRFLIDNLIVNHTKSEEDLFENELIFKLLEETMIGAYGNEKEIKIKYDRFMKIIKAAQISSMDTIVAGCECKSCESYNLENESGRSCYHCKKDIPCFKELPEEYNKLDPKFIWTTTKAELVCGDECAKKTVYGEDIKNI
jgi:hypothetical protein